MPTTKKKDNLLEQQNQVPNTTQQTAPAQSSTVQQAQILLQQQMKNGYQSQWQPQINNLMEQYMNRDKFSYDVNKDALFQQLRDQYKLMGQQAMMDTMGQATALTGGYGNSYAQGVGQQAYQGFMQQLGDRMPDLYQLALDQYINEGSKMQGDIAMMMQQDNLDYGRYRDQMADQDEAYNKLVALMTNYHYEPTAEEMAAAGMPEAHKNAIMKPYYDMLTAQNGEYVEPQYPPVGPEDTEPTLSAAGLEFERKLTEAQKNSSVQGQKWNDMSKKRLEQAYNSGQLTDEDVIIIAAKFGIT